MLNNALSMFAIATKHELPFLIKLDCLKTRITKIVWTDGKVDGKEQSNSTLVFRTLCPTEAILGIKITTIIKDGIFWYPSCTTHS